MVKLSQFYETIIVFPRSPSYSLNNFHAHSRRKRAGGQNGEGTKKRSPLFDDRFYNESTIWYEPCFRFDRVNGWLRIVFYWFRNTVRTNGTRESAYKDLSRLKGYGVFCPRTGGGLNTSFKNTCITYRFVTSPSNRIFKIF